MEQIGTILRNLRTERGFTQTEVAAAISVTSQAVSKWENGSGMPDVSQLVPLADFFGVTVDCILGRRDNAAEEEITEFLGKFDDIVYYGRNLAKEQEISVEEAFDILFCHSDTVQLDSIVICQSSHESIFQTFWLLVDLLHHEVLVSALFRRFR